MRAIRSTLATLLACAAYPVMAVEVNFDDAADLGQFNHAQQSQYTPIGWDAAAGLGGAGGAPVTGSHAATIEDESYDASLPGATLETSAFFRVKDPGPILPGLPVTYGEAYVVRDANQFAGLSADSIVSSVRESSNSLELSGSIFQSSRAGSGGRRAFPKGIIQPDRWYQLKTHFQNLGLHELNWNIQVNDFGADGLQPMTTVAETRRRQADAFHYLDDTTLHAGFVADMRGATAVDSFAAATFLDPISTTALTIAPAFDVELQKDAFFTTLVEGGPGIRVGVDSLNPGANSEALMEFPLTALPDGARVLGARLLVSPNLIQSSPLISVFAYAGDGLASISDAVAVLTSVSAPIAVFSPIPLEIALDIDILTPFIDAQGFVGLRVSATFGGSVQIGALELSPPSSGPRLILDYYVPPPGDFDRDSDVDSSDLTVWRRAFAQTNEADGDGDNDSDAADFLVWQSQFGTGVSALPAGTHVPEPAAGAVAALDALATTGRRRSLTR